MRVRVIVSASKYARSPGSLRADWKRWLTNLGDVKNTPPTVGLFTEVGDDAREAALESRHWVAFVPVGKAGECGVAWDVRRHHAGSGHMWSKMVTRLDFGPRPGVRATAVFLRDVHDHDKPKGRSLDDVGDLYVVVHYPSGVQDGDDWSDAEARVRAHQSATSGTDAWIDDLTARLDLQLFRVRRVVLVYDANLDVGRLEWRRYLSRQFPGFRHVWDRTPPGDLGKRQVTVMMVRGGKVDGQPEELPTRSSDHDANTFVLD